MLKSDDQVLADLKAKSHLSYEVTICPARGFTQIQSTVCITSS